MEAGAVARAPAQGRRRCPYPWHLRKPVRDTLRALRVAANLEHLIELHLSAVAIHACAFMSTSFPPLRAYTLSPHSGFKFSQLEMSEFSVLATTYGLLTISIRGRPRYARVQLQVRTFQGADCLELRWRRISDHQPRIIQAHDDSQS